MLFAPCAIGYRLLVLGKKAGEGGGGGCEGSEVGEAVVDDGEDAVVGVDGQAEPRESSGGVGVDRGVRSPNCSQFGYFAFWG